MVDRLVFPLKTYVCVLISRPTKEASRVSHETLAQLTDSAIMKEDAKLMPEVPFTSYLSQKQKLIIQTFRLLIIDGCGLSTEEYDTLKNGFLDDLEDDQVHSALHMWHNWGWKV